MFFKKTFERINSSIDHLVDEVSIIYNKNSDFNIRLHETNNEVLYLKDIIEEQKKSYESIKEEFAKIKEQVTHEAKRNSNEPWANIDVGHDVNENGQVRVLMDWNTAFIDMLKKAGYTGRNDEEIFQKYLLTISSQYFDRDISRDFSDEN